MRNGTAMLLVAPVVIAIDPVPSYINDILISQVPKIAENIYIDIDR